MSVFEEATSTHVATLFAVMACCVLILVYAAYRAGRVSGMEEARDKLMRSFKDRPNDPWGAYICTRDELNEMILEGEE